MKIRRFFGKDMREALRLVKEELGADAVIMSNRQVSDGVELVAAYDKDASVPDQQQSSAQNVTTTDTKPVPTLSEIIGDEGPDSLKALLEQQAKHQSKPSIETHSLVDEGSSDPLDNEVKPISETSELNEIKDELSALRDVLQSQVAQLMDNKQQRMRPVQSYIHKQLVGMGLTYSLANHLTDYIPADADEREGWRYALQLMVNRIQLGGNQLLSQTGVAAFVGPTGTGKTTTIAKLAARYAKKYGSDSVALVTIDTYRIGAFEQLQTYAKIIGCTAHRAESAQVLSDVLFQLRHKRMVFVDTAGFSQRDSRLIEQFEQLVSPATEIKRYLVLQCNTQYSALQQVLEAYKNKIDNVEIDGCVLTKLDECYSLGEALSVAIESELPMSFVTDGQQVPEDIKPADAKSLVTIAAKLYKKYGLAHTYKHNNKVEMRAV